MPNRIIIANDRQIEPARFGLLSVAAGPVPFTGGENDESNGVEYVPEPCGTARSYVTDCPLPEDLTKTIDAPEGARAGNPFTVYGGWRCSPVGFDAEEIERRARQALLNGEGRAVEAILWTGDSDNGEEVWPHLAEDTEETQGSVTFSAATDVNAAGALNPVLAVAAMEEALADCYPGRGVLHMTRQLATVLYAADVLRVEGERLVTGLGTYVAAGSGYPGTSPAGAAPAAGESWLYGTGAVTVRRGEVNVVGDFRSSVDRAVNTVVRIVERTYVVTFECCHLAVRSRLEAE